MDDKHNQEKKMIPGMCASRKNVYFISYLVLAILVLSLSFKSEIKKFCFGIRYKSPVDFVNLKITFPKGIGYNAGKKSIVFFHYDAPDTYLYVGKTDLSKTTKESLEQFLLKKGFHILKMDKSKFKEFPSISISYVDTSWRYNESLYIISQNVRVTYIGTRDNYKYFKNIIQSMEFDTATESTPE